MEQSRNPLMRSFSLEPSSTWFAWAVLLLGGLLAVSAIWLTLTNLDRTSILFVLIPGTSIGSLLMVLGALGVRVSEILYVKGPTHAQETHLRTYILGGASLAMGAGGALGIWFGTIALGVTVGPLIGLAFGLAVWVRAENADA